MSKLTKLDANEVQNCLASLPSWCLKQGKLHKEFQFSDFKIAFSFMTEISEFAERIQHHPEWCNIYSKVSVDLFTHDVGGLSKHDITMAKEMDQSASRWKANH